MKTKNKLFTYDDYLHLPKDSFKYEVLGGELIVRKSPPTIHQIISGNLLVSLTHFIKQNDIGEVLPRLDVVFSMTDVVQPDILFISKKRSQIITEKNIVAAPDLIVEILCESTAPVDRNQKKVLYESYKVKEYWIFDPEVQQIEQYILRNDVFEQEGSFGRSESITSEVIEGFTLPVKIVFEG